jgi:hypothetical protein
MPDHADMLRTANPCFVLSVKSVESVVNFPRFSPRLRWNLWLFPAFLLRHQFQNRFLREFVVRNLTCHESFSQHYDSAGQIQQFRQLR